MLVGSLLVIVGVAGTVLWLAALSPYGFKRFPLAESDRTLEIRRAGTYVVFEEFPGASDPNLPPPLNVTVTGLDGKAVPVEMLMSPGRRRAVDGYTVPFHEGRAIARFDAPQAGTYLLRVGVKTPGSYAPEDFVPTSDATIALGPDLATTWLGRPWLGLVVGPVVFVSGLVVILVVRRRDRTQTRSGFGAT